MSARAGAREEDAATDRDTRRPSLTKVPSEAEAPATAKPARKKPRLAEGEQEGAGEGETARHEGAATAAGGKEEEGRNIIEQGTIRFFYRCVGLNQGWLLIAAAVLALCCG